MNLPNLITLGRLLAVPVVVWLILTGELLAAFWLFVVVGVSDAVDGFIAKRFGQVTQLGALLDPIADKSLLVASFITLGIAGQLPVWLVILVVFRDLLIVGGFMLQQVIAETTQPDPLLISKFNTAVQILLVAAVLARLGHGLESQFLVTILVWAAGITTAISGAAYLIRWARLIAGFEPGPSR